jgi:hypothetical protein
MPVIGCLALVAIIAGLSMIFGFWPVALIGGGIAVLVIAVNARYG